MSHNYRDVLYYVIIILIHIFNFKKIIIRLKKLILYYH